MILVLSTLTDEYVRVRTSAKEAGAWLDPTGDTVEFAFMTVGTDPTGSDWDAGAWETDATTNPDTYYARYEIASLAVGSYDVWVRVTDSPEVPVRHVGELHIT